MCVCIPLSFHPPLPLPFTPTRTRRRYVVRLVNHWSAEFLASAALCIVYIEEAHASDEWPISSARLAPRGSAVSIPAHKTQEDRILAARAFAEDFEVPQAVAVAADGIGNAFQTQYASWPIRWFVFELAGEGVRVSHIGDPDDSSFDMSIVHDLLQVGAGGGGGCRPLWEGQQQRQGAFACDGAAQMKWRGGSLAPRMRPRKRNSVSCCAVKIKEEGLTKGVDKRM